MDKLYELALSVPGYNQIRPPRGAAGGGGTTLQKAIGNGMTIIIIAAIVLALVYLIWGGISWILAGGDKQKIHDARMKIVYSIIGLVLVLLAFWIINIFTQAFGIQFLQRGPGGGGFGTF